MGLFWMVALRFPNTTFNKHTTTFLEKKLQKTQGFIKHKSILDKRTIFTKTNNNLENTTKLQITEKVTQHFFFLMGQNPSLWLQYNLISCVCCVLISVLILSSVLSVFHRLVSVFLVWNVLLVRVLITAADTQHGPQFEKAVDNSVIPPFPWNEMLHFVKRWI